MSHITIIAISIGVLLVVFAAKLGVAKATGNQVSTRITTMAILSGMLALGVAVFVWRLYLNG